MKIPDGLQLLGFGSLAGLICFGPALIIASLGIIFNVTSLSLPLQISAILALASGPFIMIFVMTRLFPDKEEIKT